MRRRTKLGARSLSTPVTWFETYSNDAVSGFGVDVLNLSTLPTELIEPSTRLRNAGQGVLLLVGSTILGQAFSLAYHEYGHGTRAAAAGQKTPLRIRHDLHGCTSAGCASGTTRV